MEDLKFCPYDGESLNEKVCTKCGRKAEVKMKKKWKKILYEIQEYPDNHIDKNFYSQINQSRSASQNVYDISKSTAEVVI
jgi:hypothetical protein